MEDTKLTDSYAHILKYTGLFGGVQMLCVLIGVVRNKLVALMLGPTGIGLISLFNSAIKLVSDSTNLGFSMSAVRNVSEAYEAGDSRRLNELIATVRQWGFITALAGMLACLLLSPLLNTWTFSWGYHTIHFMLLSPIVGMLALTGIEMAILKSTRHLRNLATVSVICAIVTLVTSVPIYWLFGVSAIIPALLLSALAQMLLAMFYSFRHFPLQICFRKDYVKGGMDMVHLGVAFVIAGVLGSGAEFAIRSFLNHTTSTEMLGFYNVGYTIAMTYAGMVFTAMETDYFPRLSAIQDSPARLRQMVNRQMEVSMLVVAPMIVGLVVGLPLIVPLLYNSKFLPAVAMVRVSVLSLYMRCMTLPMAYITLAKGDSRSYLFLEAVYDVVVVLLVVLGFLRYELFGAGLALLAASVIDFAVIYVYVRWRYDYSMDYDMKRIAFIQIPIGVVAYLLTSALHGWVYWLVGIAFIVLSAVLSLRMFIRRKNISSKEQITSL